MIDPKRLFLSYARADDEPFVAKLFHDLERLGWKPWYDRENMTNDGAPFTQAIGDTIRASGHLLLIVGPRSVASRYCRGEWTLALEHCVPVLPLLRLGDYDSIPAEIGSGHAIDVRAARDYGEAVNELHRILTDPVRPLTAIGGTPALPAAYVARPQYLDPLREAINSGDRMLAITSKQETAALVGIGGIGKTTLAAALAHDCEVRRTFDQIHWIDVGPGRRTQQDAALLMQAAAGGTSEDYQNYELARAAFARHLHGKKTLLILDDVWETEVAKAFQFGGVDARMLLTTRQKRIVEALHARGQAVDKLTAEEALALLNRRAGRTLDEAEAGTILTLLDGHALALTLAGAWLHKNPTKTAADLRTRLQARPDFRDLKLAETDKNLNLELALRLSYDDLPEAARGHFRALGVVAPASITVEALGALWGIEDAYDAEDAVMVLVDAGLLDPVTPEDGAPPEARYDQHPLLRSYAGALLRAAGETDAAFLRYARYFTEQAEQFITRPPQDWRDTIERDVGHVLAVGDALAALTPQGDEEMKAVALTFAYNTKNFVVRRMEYQRRNWLKTGLALGKLAGDQKKVALFLHEEGGICAAQGHLQAALDFFEKALSLWQIMGLLGGEATTLDAIGEVNRRLQQPQIAHKYYERALQLHRIVGDVKGEAATLNNIGLLCNDLGDKLKALEYFEQALQLRRIGGDLEGEMITLHNIAAVLLSLGDKQTALKLCERALLLVQKVRNRRGEAIILVTIGGIYFHDSDYSSAADVLRKAIQITSTTGMFADEAAALHNLATTLKLMGRTEEAIEMIVQVIVILRRHNLMRSANGSSIEYYESLLVQWKTLRA